jgi:hypothetical protein
LIFGGLFNIYIHKSSPRSDDFELCFNNIEEGAILKEIAGCGGDDWNKSRVLLGFVKFDLGRIKYLKQDLFCLMKNSGFFAYCEEFVTKIYNNNRGESLCSEKSAKLYNEAEIFFNNFPQKTTLLDEIDSHVLSIIN